MSIEELDPQFADSMREFVRDHPESHLAGIVVLEEDGYGRRVRYAFRDGAPEHPRCLDWHAKAHYRAWPRECRRDNRGRVVHSADECVTIGLNGLLPCGALYWMCPMTCDGKCRVGCPPPAECNKPDWTYDEPVECACWHLEPVTEDDMAIMVDGGNHITDWSDWSAGLEKIFPGADDKK